MQITRQADYAVRAILYLSRLSPGAQAATTQIAREQHIPVTFLAKIMAQLSAAGLVRATRGAHGGMALTRSASEISLLDVVETIDGPIMLNECTLNPTTCAMSDYCAVRVVWCETRADLVRRLGETNFEQLARSGAAGQRPTAVPEQPTPIDSNDQQ
jgi:Rrf2 family protein